MEEFELDAPPAQCLVQGRDHHVAHPGGHFPEERTLVLEKRYPGEQYSQPCGERGPAEVAVLVSEHHVVEATHERELQHIRMRAVTQNPRAIVLVVDGSETSRV